MERLEWIARAKPVEAVTIDIGFLINDSFYYGPENGFTEQEWQQYREPLYRPAINLHGRFALSQTLVPSTGELVRYYQDVLRLVAKHNKQVTRNSYYFWLRPVIFTCGVFDITFAWHDTWQESETVLDNLSATSEGVLYEDIEQGWQFAAFAEEGKLFLREYDPDSDHEYFCIACDRTQFSGQIPAVLERMTRVLQELRTTLGCDFWARR